MQLRVLGCGDAFGSGGRFNTCFLVTATAHSFLIDCGASSLIAMRRFEIVPNAIGTIFITHLHGDHFGGLPFVLLDAQFVSQRATPLTIAGPPGLRQRLHDLMEVMFPGSMQLDRRHRLDIVELDPEVPATVNDVQVTPFLVRHPSGAPSFALRFECDGKVVCYTGDTEWVDTIVDAAQGADLFISEAWAFERPVPYHLTWTTLRGQLARINAKRVLITHMGPEMLRRGAEVTAQCAEDGMVFEL